MNLDSKMIFELSKDINSINKINLDSFSEDYFVDLLEKNQVLQTSLNNLKNINSKKCISIKNKIKNLLEKDYIVNTEEKTKWVLDFLDKFNVKCMLHKFPYYDREQSDIDILIPDDKESLVLEELEKENFKAIGFESFKTPMSRKENNSKFTIHVHTKIKWESEFISTIDVWERSQKIKLYNHEIQIPSYEDSILIECAHTVFENRVIRFCDLFQFINLTKNKINWEKVSSRLVYYKFPAVGFLYLTIINQIANDFFHIKPVPENFLLELKAKLPKLEYFFCINPILNQFKFRTSMPIQIKLSASATLFLTYNKRISWKKFFWAINILFLAGIKRFKNR
jgi:hypothetical protein